MRLQTRIAGSLMFLVLMAAMLACLGSGSSSSPARSDFSDHTPILVTANTLPPQWTATPSESATPLPGWKQFSGREVTIWLPESFTGGDPSTDLEQFITDLRAMGGHFAQSADSLAEDPSNFLLWVFDTAVGATGSMTNMTVVRDEIPAEATIEEFLDAVLEALPAEYQVAESRTVALARYPDAAKIIFETSLEGIELKEVTYLVKHGSSIYVITFATGADEFDQRAPVFDQSANTLILQP